MTDDAKFDFVWDAEALGRRRGWLRAVGGRAHRFERVVIDSRADDLGGALFVAIRGANHDGHAHVGEAVAKGAAGVVIEDGTAIDVPAGTAVYRVADTRRALGELATMRRRAFSGPVVAITGSAGKSSTKHFLQGLLGDKVFVNPGNLNNEIGVPLSIFQAPLNAAAWVLELGMNHAGEIDRLTDLLEPDLGVLLPAGAAHIGHLGSVEAVRAAKAELAHAAAAPARVVLADPAYVPCLEGASVQAVAVGELPGSAYRIVRAEDRFPAGLELILEEPAGQVAARPALIGRHWALGVATAWAVGRELGLIDRRHRGRLEKLTTMPGRMSLSAYRGGWLIDDSYNASPESMTAALAAVGPLAKRLKLGLLLGDMYELGEHGPALHAEAAHQVAALEPAWVACVGRQWDRALTDAGVAHSAFDQPEAALAAALDAWEVGRALLVKGANSTGLYAAVQAWKEHRCSTSS